MKPLPSMRLIKQGEALRVTVGKPGHQSSVWRFWTGLGQKADVYAAIRPVASQWKFSLHETGDPGHPSPVATP